MDVESLEKSERRRGGFLDVFLVVSVMFLFAAVTTLAVVGVMTVKDVESRLERPPWTRESQASGLAGVSPDAAYKHFAHLEAFPTALDNATMKWDVQQTSVGSNFQYDRDNHWIMPLRSGTYFMYINLTLTCTYSCKAGVLTINVGKKLNCQVHLPVKTPAVNCWAVSRVGAMERLLSQMTVQGGDEEELKNWSLEMGFGMFLVD